MVLFTLGRRRDYYIWILSEEASKKRGVKEIIEKTDEQGQVKQPIDTLKKAR